MAQSQSSRRLIKEREGPRRTGPRLGVPRLTRDRLWPGPHGARSLMDRADRLSESPSRSRLCACSRSTAGTTCVARGTSAVRATCQRSPHWSIVAHPCPFSEARGTDRLAGR